MFHFTLDLPTTPHLALIPEESTFPCLALEMELQAKALESDW
jgi:hypothetical protein